MRNPDPPAFFAVAPRGGWFPAVCMGMPGRFFLDSSLYIVYSIWDRVPVVPGCGASGFVTVFHRRDQFLRPIDEYNSVQSMEPSKEGV